MIANKVLRVLFVIFSLLLIFTLASCQSTQEYLWENGCRLTGNSRLEDNTVWVPMADTMMPIYDEDTYYQYECNNGIIKWYSIQYDISKYVPPVYTHVEN